MRDRIREFVVLAIKGPVSALVAWLVVRGLELPDDFAAQLEVAAAGLAWAVVNWVLNLVASQLHKVPHLGTVVDIVWPTPAYNTNEIPAAAPPAGVVAPEAG